MNHPLLRGFVVGLAGVAAMTAAEKLEPTAAFGATNADYQAGSSLLL